MLIYYKVIIICTPIFKLINWIVCAKKILENPSFWSLLTVCKNERNPITKTNPVTTKAIKSQARNLGHKHRSVSTLLGSDYLLFTSSFVPNVETSLPTNDYRNSRLEGALGWTPKILSLPHNSNRYRHIRTSNALCRASNQLSSP